ncbi:NAD(P)/FAD-dependent oxidoreductase [Sphaerisporangium corydalis]|uniref:NAD(P)/FAD-dependent oxidoreductase n=1 Tax=Sphaerisporangium corydalis TaxID=1441875 RepID=A0ABV9E8F8_9ACTN|nr:FAD-dependent monooxygenase [Sphaerisporangium corydalis]
MPVHDHAIVIGASVAGLLAAAALTDTFQSVTILDRDTLPPGTAHRRGTAQSRHAHGLLARGREAMEELLPGLTEELAAQGGMPRDLQLHSRWISEGRPMAKADSGLIGVTVSRALLEGHLRRRVAAIPGVRVLEGRAVLGLVACGGRVTGVVTGTETLRADLVVDASGRGSQAPRWLAEMGYEPAAEERVRIELCYATRVYARKPDDLDGDQTLVTTPTDAVHRAGVALAVEGDRWMVTVGGYGGDQPPLDHEGFTAFTKTLAAPDLYELVRDAEPIEEGRPYRTPANVRRRYERLARFPGGFLVTGDAVCAFNPMYGQGMTVASLEALALRDAIAGGGLDGVARRFFRSIRKVVDGPWDVVVGGDLRFPEVEGVRTRKAAMVNAYLRHFHAAAARDPELGRRFLRVANLIDPPASLMKPSTLLRVWRAGRSAGARAEGLPGGGKAPALQVGSNDSA